jgi:hypothetical protein
MAKLTYTGAEVQALLDKVNELAGHKGILLVDGEQVVTGIKNFINGLQIGGKLVKYDAATNAFVFPANAVFEGGVAWNTKLEGFEKQTITAAVQVDWDTIGKNENGELYVIGGTSGGGVVGGVTLDEVKNYLTAEKYTTETWVSAQNYATQSWVNNKGYITGISSSMVTSALGYTPLDAANFTKSNIKSTLGISDWALASVKPSYKFAEISEKPTTLGGYGITDAYTKAQADSALAKKWTQDDSLIANWNTAYSWGNHALAGYATESFVTTRGYITASAIPTKVSAFTNDASYATESFVTSRGYITSAAISKANIKSILGISDWALGSSSPFATLGKISTEIDSDSLLTGVGYTQDYSPVEGAYIYGQLLNFNGYRGHTQLYIPSGGDTIYLRSHWDPTGMASRTWKEILTSGSYAKHALSLTTDQDVTGIKNFVNGFKVDGNLITYDANLKAFVLNGNLIVKGGIAWEKQNS